MLENLERFIKKEIEEWLVFEFPDIQKREVTFDLFQTTAIIGPRRVGKTYAMWDKILHLGKENVLYLNFESERLQFVTALHLDEIIKIYYSMAKPKSKPYLFFDEIQNVPGWEKWVRRMHDQKRFKIVISGSSAKMLSKELSTALTGRAVMYELFPLSFREFLRFKDLSVERSIFPENKGRILGFLNEYLSWGGFPEVVRAEENKVILLRSYYQSIFYRDLLARYSFNPDILDALLKLVLTNFSSRISLSKLYNFLRSLGYRISKPTVANYLHALEEIYFYFPVRIFSYSVKDIMQHPVKSYLIDIGYASLYGLENIGRRMENIVAVELLRRKSYWNQELEIYYWKDYQQREVDFVVKHGPKVEELIQVTYASEKDEIPRRELRSLLKAADLLKAKHLTVITWDYEDEEKIEGKIIRYVPLWRWLLH